MNRLHPLSWIATAVVIACLNLGCQPKPGAGPGLGSPGIISCGTKAVSDHAVEMLAPVNMCLSGDGSIDACLLGLVQPAIGVGIDVVMCLTRHEGSAARAAAQANPGDTADARRSQRARAFLDGMAQRGYTLGD